MATALYTSMKLDTLPYSPQMRAERLIAAGRVVLATFSLVAIWFDPAEPAQYVKLTYGLLAGYVGYALLLALLAWRLEAFMLRLRLSTHVFDIAVFYLFMYVTEGASSPFFVYFIFALVCATLRWQWRGTLWTGLVTLAAFIAMGVYASEVLQHPAFELNRFIIRSIYLAVVMTLLGYLGAYEHRLHRELSQLAAWPRATVNDPQLLVRGVLEHAGTLLAAPRLLMVWEEPEEPWVHVVLWTASGVQSTREPPDTLATLIAAPLAGKSFLCANMQASMPSVLYIATTGIQLWSGTPLLGTLQARFAMRTVVALPLHGESVEGYLFVLDKSGITSDDLILGTIVAREVVTEMEQSVLWQRLQQAAATEERLRLARDLHDGLLQSLTGVALQLNTVRRLLGTDVVEAQKYIHDIQEMLAAEQRDLRLFIQELRPDTPEALLMEMNLSGRLADLAARIERQWGLQVVLDLASLEEEMPQELTRALYRLVHEAVVNAARHAQATVVCVSLRIEPTHVHLTVVDNGRGFPFRGHYDLAALTDMHLGPVTLKERIMALRGTLSIDSGVSGARLHITLPRQ